jgi:hypothetical protein
MEKIMKRLSNLLSVKSLVTLLLTVVFTVLALRGDITGNDFLTIFLMVITFYFGTQSQKAQDAMDAKGDGDGTEN